MMVQRVTSQDQNEPRPGDDAPAASGVVEELRQAHRAIYNAACQHAEDIVQQLVDMLGYRGRGSNLAASIRAGEMLLGLIGINTQGDSQTAGSGPGGTIINTSGPTQVVQGEGETGPDKLTQELIDIVRKGNNGHKPNGKK